MGAALLAVAFAAALQAGAPAPPSPPLTPPDAVIPVQPVLPRLVPGETPPAAWTQGEWTAIREDRNVAVWLDESAVRRDGDRARLRIRALLVQSHYDGARYGLAEMEVDCRRRTARGIALTEYDGAGAVLRQETEDATAREHPWPEGDPASETFTALCHRTDPGEEGEE